jgi:predicted transcriptional regulator of viral defense system
MNDEIMESHEVREHARNQLREQAMRLLEKRVRRRLRDGRLVLHKSRGERNTWLFGRYWICDSMGVMPILRHVELPSLARRLRVWFADLDVE